MIIFMNESKSELLRTIQSNDEMIEYYVYVLGNDPWNLINESKDRLRAIIEGYWGLASKNNIL